MRPWPQEGLDLSLDKVKALLCSLKWALSKKLVLWLFHFPAYILSKVPSDWKGDSSSNF